MDGEVKEEKKEVPAAPPPKKVFNPKVRKKARKSNRKHPHRANGIHFKKKPKGNKKGKRKVGRPPRGEGTHVVGTVLKKGERQGVRVAESLFKKLHAGAKAAGVPVSVLLRAGGIYLAELVQTRKWTKATTEAFLKKYGGAS